MTNHKQLRVVGLSFLACTSFASFEARASCGTFGIVKGDVKIESGTTHKLETAVAGGKVCLCNTVISGKDARAKILINAAAPSGKNELNISPDTRLTIANYEFNPTDNKKKVMLNILSGKFAPRPFQITTMTKPKTDRPIRLRFAQNLRSRACGVRILWQALHRRLVNQNL